MKYSIIYSIVITIGVYPRVIRYKLGQYEITTSLPSVPSFPLKLFLNLRSEQADCAVDVGIDIVPDEDIRQICRSIEIHKVIAVTEEEI